VGDNSPGRKTQRADKVKSWGCGVHNSGKVEALKMANKQTGKKAASAASKILSSKKSTPAQKKVAASDLSQAPSKNKSK